MLLTLAAAKTTSATLGPIIYMVALIGIFYFLFMRPQQQRQKQHQSLLSNLNVNERVVAAGGIYGTIIKIKDKSLVLKIAENTKVEVLKTSVAYKVDEDEKETAE